MIDLTCIKELYTEWKSGYEPTGVYRRSPERLTDLEILLLSLHLPALVKEVERLEVYCRNGLVES